MASFADLDKWVRNINEDLGEWLFKQINERIKRQGRLPINQQRLEDRTIKEYRLGSPELPKERLITWLQSPTTTPFVGYSILVQYLRTSRHSLKKKGSPLKETEAVATKGYERLQRARRNISFRALLEEAWNYMEEDGERTVEKNPKCLELLERLGVHWERPFDRQLLACLSFVPQPAIGWGLKMVREALPEVRRVHAPYRRRYLNPWADLENDPLVSDELKDLPPEDQRKIIAGGFRVLSKKREKQIFSAMGIDKKAGILRQGIWRLILPPLVDYLAFLQGGPSVKPSRDRACREASLILNARYPDLWPHSPRRVKYSVTRG